MNTAEKTEQIPEQLFPDSTPEEVALWISASADRARIGTDVLKVAMDLPPLSRIPAAILADSIARVLAEYHISCPEEVHNRLKRNETDEFTFPAPAREEHLRPRTVVINCSPKISTLQIRGEPPLDGIEGSILVFFDYKVKPGKLLSDGSIDFREINRFPQVGAGQHILTVFEPTGGIPGTDAYGYPIAPEGGKTYSLEVGEGIVVKTGKSEDSQQTVRELYAEKSGIIICGFEGQEKNESSLCRIAVENHLVMGDVDFSTGSLGCSDQELRCTADVEVRGDIRGRFSVVIDGHLEVGGAVEGEVVDVSGSVTAGFIRSSVRSGKHIKVGAAHHARMTAEDIITIEKEVARCRLSADHIAMIPEEAQQVLCTQVHISANSVQMEKISLRNMVEIDLGRNYFMQLDQMETTEDNLKRTLRLVLVELKDRVAVIGERLKRVQARGSADNRKVVQLVRSVTAGILKGEISPEQAHVKAKEAAAAYGYIINPLIKPFVNIIKLAKKRNECQSKLDAIEEQKEVISESMNKMKIRINGILEASAKLTIRYGQEEQCWQVPPDRERKHVTIELDYVSGMGLMDVVRDEE
ncbi:MAG TPA: DUF342 domain-containing protein [Thermodesulfobacteriaceae bacterium]|nr:DUF342 domain-containing protein [Thermodesulfobacteriaceae bacterium]